MWEITLVGKLEDIEYFEQLKISLCDEFYSDVVVAISQAGYLTCSIATMNKKCIKGIEDLVYETIIKTVKCEHFEQYLTIFGFDKKLNSFMLTSLIMIDLIDEIEFARSKTSLTKLVNIRSFVYFKLKKIVTVWDKVIDYINSNFSYQMQETLYLQFLKFIADNSHSSQDILYLEEELEEMCLYDREKNKIGTMPKGDEIGIIVNLIMYSPKKLIINCIDSLSIKVSNLISYIFEDRVSVLL